MCYNFTIPILFLLTNTVTYFLVHKNNSIERTGTSRRERTRPMLKYGISRSNVEKVEENGFINASYVCVSSLLYNAPPEDINICTHRDKT